MSDQDASTPRVFLARHGETEWTINGRYTGVSELELTANGESQVKGSGKLLVGQGKLIDPQRITRIFVSPRRRAQKTFGLLFGDSVSIDDTSKVEITDDIAEWGYGDYEGLLTSEIRERRQEKGLDADRPWDIWRDGCEGGESSQQVTDRMDRLIAKIHEIQGPYMHGEKPVDVVVVAHGHILRAFAKRFLKYPMSQGLPAMLPPGAIGVLSYQDHDIQDPGFLLGLALPLDVQE